MTYSTESFTCQSPIPPIWMTLLSAFSSCFPSKIQSTPNIATQTSHSFIIRSIIRSLQLLTFASVKQVTKPFHPSLLQGLSHH
mmetsp:Transcript_45669/g.97077  ORF Transcript_45669/g.97077 Transcript_45669/m.97077 type:complete len:83 (+) Transcript_45669:119-367(+)